MFQHIYDNIMNNEDIEYKSQIENGILLNPKRDPKEVYISSVIDNDLKMVKTLILSNKVDVNYRLRYDIRNRSRFDMIPLDIAICKYLFDMAELLISLGHHTDGFTVILNPDDKENMFIEDYNKAIQFCIDHNIEVKYD